MFYRGLIFATGIYSCGAATDFHRFPITCFFNLAILINEKYIWCLHFLAYKLDCFAFSGFFYALLFKYELMVHSLLTALSSPIFNIDFHKKILGCVIGRYPRRRTVSTHYSDSPLWPCQNLFLKLYRTVTISGFRPQLQHRRTRVQFSGISKLSTLRSSWALSKSSIEQKHKEVKQKVRNRYL